MSLSVPEWIFLGLAYTAGAATLAVAAFALGDWGIPRNPLRGTRLGAQFGSPRRRRNIRHYLDAIGEPYAEDHVVADVRVEFYLPDRDVAITLSKRAADSLRQSGTYVVYCEPRIGPDQLGARLPFDTPDPRTTRRTGHRQSDTQGTRQRTNSGGRSAGRTTGRAQATGDQRSKNVRVTRAFRRLGLSRGATEAEVKAAYREKVKDVHPDRGGSEAAFAQVQEAYATAKEYAADDGQSRSVTS